MAKKTEMSQKILGEENKNNSPATAKANYLAENVVWKVSKKDCGDTLFNGVFTACLMNPQEVRMAMDGKIKIKNETMTFERLSK